MPTQTKPQHLSSLVAVLIAGALVAFLSILAVSAAVVHVARRSSNPTGTPAAASVPS